MPFSVRTPRPGRGWRGSAPRPPWPPVRATLRELALLLLALAALAGAGIGSVSAAKDLATPDPVEMPVPEKGTRKLELPLLVNLAVDESPSTSESDPDDRRWTDTAALGRWLAKYQRPDDLVVVTRFSSDARRGAIVSARELMHHPRTLAPAPSSSGTAFVPVVGAAEEAFAEAQGAYYRVIILLTDGDSPDAQDAIDRLPLVANRVFVVALDRGDVWNQARTGWEAAGFPVMKLGNRAPNEIGAAMARAIMDATGESER